MSFASASPHRLGLIPVLLVAFACGGADAPPPETGSVTSTSAPAGLDPCTLLTAEDVRATTGVAPGTPTYDMPQCIWPSADGSEPFLVQLLTVEAGFRTYDEYIAEVKSQMGDLFDAGEYEQVDGLGDFGVIVSGMIVQAFRNGRLIQATVSLPGDSFSVPAARAVLERALTRLP